MEDGDLVATVVAVPFDPGSGAVTVPASRTGTPELGCEATTTSTTPDDVVVAPVAVENDPQTAGSSSASDRQAAITDLMRTQGTAVLGFCIRILGDLDLAEDVRQQTFLDAFRDFDRFEEGSSRRAWLFGIACHRCLDALRNQARHSRWIENDDEAVINTRDPGSRPHDRIEQAQVVAALEACLKHLSPEARMTVLLRFNEGLTYEELAVGLSTRADALQMRVTRALPKLRRCLESKGILR